MKIRQVVNTSARVRHIAYRDKHSGAVMSATLPPGLNEVPEDILRQIMKEPEGQRLLDERVLSGAAGDVDMASDVAELQRKGENTQTLLPPERPGNTTDTPASLVNSDAAASALDNNGQTQEKASRAKQNTTAANASAPTKTRAKKKRKAKSKAKGD